MELILSICLGIGLSAACGFRIFIPFLIMSVAARADHLSLVSGFDWIESDAALITFAVASALEIGAYFIPWLDNLLDSMAAPTAVVAGVLAAAATIEGTSPLVSWTIAAIVGGGAAGLVQTTTTFIRGASSMLTAGFGNPVVSSAEAGGALTLSAVAVALPALAFLLVMTVLLVAATRVAKGIRVASPPES